MLFHNRPPSDLILEVAAEAARSSGLSLVELAETNRFSTATTESRIFLGVWSLLCRISFAVISYREKSDEKVTKRGSGLI